MHSDGNDDADAYFVTGILGYDGTEADYPAKEYHALAYQAFLAAKSLDNDYMNAIFILLIHATELSLKSYLLLRSATVYDLQVNYGHNIEKLLLRCKDDGLSLSDETESLFEEFFYDFDEDKVNRDAFSKLPEERKIKYRNDLGEIFLDEADSFRKENQNVPYNMALILAYIFDDEQAKHDICSKAYRNDRGKIKANVNMRYSLQNCFPGRNSAQRAVLELLDAADPSTDRQQTG